MGCSAADVCSMDGIEGLQRTLQCTTDFSEELLAPSAVLHAIGCLAQ